MGIFTANVPEEVYPDGWRRLSDFEYITPLVIHREADASLLNIERKTQYLIAADYRVAFKVDGQRRELVVPKGMLTDLASAPAVARPIIGRVGPHLEASIVHDFLYVAWQDIAGRGPRKEDQRFADDLFKLGMEKAQVPRFRAWLIYKAVRNFGWSVYQDKNEPRYFDVWSDSP